MSESQNIVLSSWPAPQFQYCFSYQQGSCHADGTEKPHIHDCYEFYINVSGDVAFLVNNRLYPVKKGDVIVSRPGDVHICIYQSPARHERFCFWLQCSEDSPLLAFTCRKEFSNFLHFSDDTRRELLRLLYRLKDAEEHCREPARSAYIFRLLTLFNEGEQTEPEQPALPNSIQQVLDHINANFTQMHCVEDIITAVHISSSTLNRWFRTYLQLSPHKYLEALKLSFAQRLLLEGRSVTDACICSGFTDCSRFIAVFKNRFGQTPLQYQKHHSR